MIALVVGVVVFVLSWIPLVGVAIGVPGGIVGIILGVIGVALPRHRMAAAAGLFLSLLALVFKSIPGLNLL